MYGVWFLALKPKRDGVFALKCLGLMLIVLLLQACAGSSIFLAYPDQIKPIKAQIIANNFVKPKDVLNGHRDDADKILYMMERGRVAQINGDYAESIADFKVAMEQIKVDEDKAKITASGTAAAGASLLTNDNAIPYSGDGYEKVFLYHFQALNYLFSKDFEGAMVEVRRANEEQTYELQQHEKELAQADEKAREQAEKNKNFMNSFQAMAEIAGHVKNSFQNAYTFYTSGVLYEVMGQKNDAYIDYKKALEIYPNNPYVQKDVLRLAKELQMEGDLEQFKDFKVQPDVRDASKGDVVILYEHGFAPPKSEVRVGLFTDKGIIQAAFPTYVETWFAETPLVVATDSRELGFTSPIVNVQAMAAKALQEKLPGMMLRQILRIVAKQRTNEESEKVSQLFSVATKIFNLVSEKADRRSWLTLPNDAQIFRTYLDAGDHVFQLNSGSASTTLQVKVEPKKTTIIRVVGTGTSMHTAMITL